MHLVRRQLHIIFPESTQQLVHAHFATVVCIQSPKQQREMAEYVLSKPLRSANMWAKYQGLHV